MTGDRWLEALAANRERTRCPVDLGTYFRPGEVAGMPMAVMDIGPCSLPSGRVLVRDPVTYLCDPGERPYMDSVQPGEYRTEVAVVLDDGCDRYAAVRLRFTEAEPVAYYEALVGYEDIYHIGDGEYFGFNADTGLACICDEAVHLEYCRWFEGMVLDDPDFDVYTDVLAELFEDNARENPLHQRAAGDWLNWTVPGTDHHVPILQTGFGDGAYPVYWGYDAAGGICCMVAQFIDVELAYGDAERA